MNTGVSLDTWREAHMVTSLNTGRDFKGKAVIKIFVERNQLRYRLGDPKCHP